MVYQHSDNNHGQDDSLSFLDQIKIWLHTLFCPICAEKIERFETARNIMKEDFFPSSLAGQSWSSLEDSIMSKIAAEEETETHIIPAGISTRGWVIAGLIIFISLTTAFFGFDFKTIAYEMGVSFLLPVGIIIGIFLTTYGALFIGSHLKELTERFGL